ncbi:MAG: hypothetical protein PHV68_00760 [Candidatus Gastranaerophilales bacterium]|nr:hypothetical protein [Candidatus Gastranaerophilales bacterium]
MSNNFNIRSSIGKSLYNISKNGLPITPVTKAQKVGDAIHDVPLYKGKSTPKKALDKGTDQRVKGIGIHIDTKV